MFLFALEVLIVRLARQYFIFDGFWLSNLCPYNHTLPNLEKTVSQMYKNEYSSIFQKYHT
jgi:hypothetical protein